MDRNEDGEAEFPEGVQIPPRLRDVAFVTGFRLRRLEDGASSARGYLIPAVEMELSTTEGPLTFLLTRDEMSQLANGIVEVLCDA